MNTIARTIPTLLLSGFLSVAQADEPKDAHAGHQPPAADNAPTDRMQENMRHMRDLMAKIRATTDPTERDKLLREHRELMHEQMRSMQGMGRMGGCDDMMGQMMDQMMQHEDATKR